MKLSKGAYARNTDPVSSHDGAEHILPDVNRLEAMVLEAVRNSGNRGITQRETSVLLGIEMQTITPRFRPLVDKGFIKDSGRKKLEISGVKCILWVAANVEEKEKQLELFQ